MYFRGVDNAHSLWLVAQSQHLRFRAELLEFAIFATGSAEFALQAADNLRKLRRKGFTIRRIADCWIATFCMRQGYALLHRDRDFDPFESELGLRVVKP